MRTGDSLLGADSTNSGRIVSTRGKNGSLSGSEQACGGFREPIALASHFGNNLVEAERAWLGRPFERKIDPIEQRFGA